MHLWRFQGALWHTHFARTSIISKRFCWIPGAWMAEVVQPHCCHASSLKPFVFNGLKKALPFSTTLKPQTPEFKKSGQGYSSLAGHAQRLVLFLAGLRSCLRILVSVLSIIMNVSQ